MILILHSKTRMLYHMTVEQRVGVSKGSSFSLMVYLEYSFGKLTVLLDPQFSCAKIGQEYHKWKKKKMLYFIRTIDY